MAEEQKQLSLDIDDAKTANTKHQAEVARKLFKDFHEKKIDLKEFNERAKALDVGKTDKITTHTGVDKYSGVSKAGASGGSGANPVKTGSLSPFNMKKGGKVSSASKRADGCAIHGKTRA
jgi:hypothetical protein